MGGDSSKIAVGLLLLFLKLTQTMRPGYNYCVEITKMLKANASSSHQAHTQEERLEVI